MIDKFKNKFNNHKRQFPAASTNNILNLNHYLILPYVGTASIKFGKRIAALFRHRLDTDIKIGYQTFEIISYFNLKFPLPALFCSNVVYKYTCSCDNNMSYIDLTTRQLFLRSENRLSKIQSSSNSAINLIAISAKPEEKQCQQSKTSHYWKSAVLTLTPS